MTPKAPSEGAAPLPFQGLVPFAPGGGGCPPPLCAPTPRTRPPRRDQGGRGGTRGGGRGIDTSGCAGLPIGTNIAHHSNFCQSKYLGAGGRSSPRATGSKRRRSGRRADRKHARTRQSLAATAPLLAERADRSAERAKLRANSCRFGGFARLRAEELNMLAAIVRRLVWRFRPRGDRQRAFCRLGRKGPRPPLAHDPPKAQTGSGRLFPRGLRARPRAAARAKSTQHDTGP